jgi:hypothetical protein
VNKITARSGSPSQITITTIVGVVLNHTDEKRPKLSIYDAAKLDRDQRPQFTVLVDAWMGAITEGTTNLPVKLYHGEGFDQYEAARDPTTPTEMPSSSTSTPP